MMISKKKKQIQKIHSDCLNVILRVLFILLYLISDLVIQFILSLIIFLYDIFNFIQ
jgi:hypothetical protein